jgi:hypothetical protein
MMLTERFQRPAASHALIRKRADTYQYI